MSEKKIARKKRSRVSLCLEAGDLLSQQFRYEYAIVSADVSYLEEACQLLRAAALDISPVHRYRARALERKKDLQQRLENIQWLQRMLSKISTERDLPS